MLDELERETKNAVERVEKLVQEIEQMLKGVI